VTNLIKRVHNTKDLLIAEKVRLENADVAGQSLFRWIDVLKAEGTVQTILCTIPNMSKWNFL